MMTIAKRKITNEKLEIAIENSYGHQGIIAERCSVSRTTLETYLKENPQYKKIIVIMKRDYMTSERNKHIVNCKDCGIEIYKKSIRCKSCAAKRLVKEGRHNSILNMKEKPS